LTPLEETWELRIHLCIIWGAQRQLPFPCECHQARKDTSLNAPFAWRNELCDDFTAIRHEHTLAGPDFPNVLAQTVFQFAKTHAFHHTNVASRSYIVKVRPATEDGTTFTAVALVVQHTNPYSPCNSYAQGTGRGKPDTEDPASTEMETITLGVILKSRISMLLTASVDPNNGQYTWSSPDASVSFDNSSAGTVHVTATSYSGGISDTQVTLNYRYNNKNAQDQPSSPAEFERPASWQS